MYEIKNPKPYHLLVQAAVSALRFNGNGTLVASGGQDTDVIVWDVVAQAGLFRLRGHHGQVELPIT